MKTLLPIAVMLCATVSRAQTVEPPHITGMQVHLFNSATGTWSEDVADQGLWNRVDTHGAVVVVQISGPPHAVYNERKGTNGKYTLRLVATEKNRATPLLDRSRPVDLLNSSGKLHIPFLFYPNGCTSVQLKATLAGPSDTKPIERSVDYNCGE